MTKQLDLFGGSKELRGKRKAKGVQTTFLTADDLSGPQWQTRQAYGKDQPLPLERQDLRSDEQKAKDLLEDANAATVPMFAEPLVRRVLMDDRGVVGILDVPASTPESTIDARTVKPDEPKSKRQHAPDYAKAYTEAIRRGGTPAEARQVARIMFGIVNAFGKDLRNPTRTAYKLTSKLALKVAPGMPRKRLVFRITDLSATC